MKTKLIIILLASLLGCDQCEPDPPLTELEKLPPATQEGKNTFGCLVNGKAWVTKTSIDAAAFYQGGVLSIGAGTQTPHQGISLTIRDSGQPIKIGSQFEFPDTIKSYSAIFFTRSASHSCYYDDVNTIAGYLAISHIDRKKFIVSGLFEFAAQTIGCDTVRITSGRFDLTYAP